MSEAAPLHDDLGHIAFLLGTWVGDGEGVYPTIDPFAYTERIEIDHVGDAYLTLVQWSWDADGGAIHLERGFIRPGEGDEVELTLAHPLGLVEVAHGRPDGEAITFRTAPGGVGRTRTGLDVVGLERRYRVEGNELTYEVDMATERTDMSIHLRGSLRRA